MEQSYYRRATRNKKRKINSKLNFTTMKNQVFYLVFSIVGFGPGAARSDSGYMPPAGDFLAGFETVRMSSEPYFAVETAAVG